MKKVCNYYLTLRCNATCEFCDIWQKKEYKNIKEAELEVTLKNIEGLPALGVSELRLEGGEPLLYAKLPEVLKKAKETGLRTVLTTNAILYPENYRKLDGLVDQLYFSLDYPMRDEHDRSRGVQSFTTLWESLRLARELKKEPAIIYTVTRDSILYLPEAVDLCLNHKVKMIINPVYDYLGTQGFETASIDHMKYFFRHRYARINLAQMQFLRAQGNKVHWPRCHASRTTVTFLPDGKRIEPCFFNQGGREGREAVCSSCMRWPYMLPSFQIGFDRYRLLDLYSKWFNDRKEKKR